MFPITPTNIRTRNLALDHPAWAQTLKPWWRFLTDTHLLSWEEVEVLSKQKRPLVVPHFDESRWVIQERRIVDFKRSALAHIGYHPNLKLIQILSPIKKCNLLVCYREDTMGILKYMIIWKPDWTASKDLLRRMGWSMVDAAMMNPSSVEILLGQFV